MNLLFLCLGGAAGAVFRYLIGLGIMRRYAHPPIPMAMIAVNLLGSCGLGFFLSSYSGHLPGDAYQDPLFLFISIGFFGSFTTFSTFSLEAAELIKRYQYKKAAIYVSISIIGSIGMFMIGFTIGVS